MFHALFVISRTVRLGGPHHRTAPSDGKITAKRQLHRPDNLKFVPLADRP